MTEQFQVIILRQESVLGFVSLWTLILELTGSSIQKGGGETLPEYDTMTATKIAAAKERENIKML